jgi:hypothetical protein
MTTKSQLLIGTYNNKSTQIKGCSMASKQSTLVSNWGLPVVLLFSALTFDFNFRIESLLVAIAFVWLGSTYLIKAVNEDCKNFIATGIIFLVGAILVVIFGLKILHLSQYDLACVVWGTIALAVLSCLPVLLNKESTLESELEE